MPREQINFPAPLEPSQDWNGTPPPVHGEAWPEPELNVSWTRAADHGPGNVQVSLLLPTAYVEHLAKSLADPDSPAGVSGIGAFSPSLPRDELNRLIRTLRRARDQAYGADE